MTAQAAPSTASASFPPEAISARQARAFLREFLVRRGRDDLADAAGLALSEVVTNAVLHAHTCFDVTLDLDGAALRVEVTDGNPQLPVQRDYAEQATTGRGMELIAAYTDDCGVEAGGPDGKTVWFVVTAGEVGEPDASPEELLAAWDIDLDVTATPADTGPAVVLLGLPPTLWLAAREHHDAVLRELALHGAQHPDAVPPPERFALADRARTWISTHVVAELERQSAAARPSEQAVLAQLAPPPGIPATVDLHMHLPADAADAFSALQDVLDTAERLAAADLLLVRPALPEVVAVRDWACEQAIAQSAGVLPSPWPGTAQERFTGPPPDRDAPAEPDWDASTVTDADHGMVAADDRNRIVAVSRPLADALGWEVDDLVGRRIIALIPPEFREAHVAGFTRHLATGQERVLGVPLRLPVLRRDGTRVECALLISLAPTTSGRAVFVAELEPVEPAP